MLRANDKTIQPAFAGAPTLFAAFLLLFMVGCVSEPGLDKAKFAELDRAGQDLKTALRSGKPCDVPDEVVQRLVAGTAALKDRTASRVERDLLNAYGELAAICRDGQLLCQYRSHLTRFQFVPKGRIYVTQELDPIVDKYDLLTQKHVYQPTGMSWRSISVDAIGVVWEQAEFKIKSIEVLEQYS